MSKYFLGVDGGATKTMAVVVDDRGREVARGVSEGSNATIVGIAKASQNIRSAILNALSQKDFKVHAAVLAIAGVDTELLRKSWEEVIKKDAGYSRYLSLKFRVVNDTQAALRAGTEDKNAVVVIAGTGSNCWGRNEFGEEAKSGGVDYILSDQGSGYAIGLEVLRTVVCALDGRGSKTQLVNLLFETYKVGSIDDLVTLVYKKPWNKTDIAGVAPLAEVAAKKGDKVARQIIEKAAFDLAVMIMAVVRKLTLGNKKYTLVLSGSVFKIQNILIDCLKRDVLKFSSHTRFVKPQVGSAVGAAYLAMNLD